MKSRIIITGAIMVGLLSGFVTPASTQTTENSRIANSIAQQASVAEVSPEVNTVVTQNGGGLGVKPKAKAKVKKQTKTSLNMRTGASTKYKVIKTLKKNTTVTLTGSKKGKWVKVSSSSKTGWVSGSYLKSIPSKKSTAKKPTAKQQRDWKVSLPSACRAATIKTIDIKNPKSSRWSMSFSTSANGKNVYYTLRINGKIKPSHPAAKALMKHECGHVLAAIYVKKKGGSAYSKLLNKGWKSSDKMRKEKVADCIADQLGAVRHKTGKGSYTVGYKTKCSSKQKSVAKSIKKYSQYKRY